MKLELTMLQEKKLFLIDSNYYRPTEVDLLVGDAKKPKITNWTPKTNLNRSLKK
jgi:GDP-D-mannose dehydratase